MLPASYGLGKEHFLLFTLFCHLRYDNHSIPWATKVWKSNAGVQSWNINHPLAAEGRDGGLSCREDGEEKYTHLHNVTHPTAYRLIGFALFPPFLTSHKPCFEMETEGHVLLSAWAGWLLKPWCCGSRSLVISKQRTCCCTPGSFPQLAALPWWAGECPGTASVFAVTRDQIQDNNCCLERGNTFPHQLTCVQFFWRKKDRSPALTPPGCWQGGGGGQQNRLGEQ